MTSAGIPPPERLLNLVIGLASARRPVTRAQIRETFSGYAASASPAAFERLFERDKEALRRLGIPLITASVSTFDDEVGYLIDTSDYALPPLEFTPQQARIATLAATLWRDSAMQDAATRGVTKLRAAGASMGGLAPSTVDINAGATTPAFTALRDAIRERREVTFTYRAASTGKESERRVQPWRITGRRGTWYLTGYDLDRSDSRLYRIDRITGNVRRRGKEGAFEIPAPDAQNARVPVAEPVTTRVVVAAGRANALRLRAVEARPLAEYDGSPAGPALPEQLLDAWEGADVITLTTPDVIELSRAIAGLGEHALVLEPSELREQVIELLRAVGGMQNGGK